jgi:hypothetical protein
MGSCTTCSIEVPMRSFVLSLLVGGSLAVIAVPSRAPSFRQVTRVVPTTAWSAERETARIRAHFDSVLAEFGARSVGGLTSEQRARRATVIATLRAYRDRGAFPRNYDFPGGATPYFVDRQTGVLCAVAHLLESTGRRDIVDRVAAANNNVWVGELAEDAELARWLREHGLTLEEAARIQVPYEQDNSAPYLTSTLVGVGVSSVASVVNLTGNRSGRAGIVSFLGAAGGLGTIGLGIAGVKQEAPTTASSLNLIAGGLALITSIQSQRRYASAVKLTREAERRKQQAALRDVQTSVTPLLSVGTQPSAGLAVQVRF